MGILGSIHTIKDFLSWALAGPDHMRKAVDDAAVASRVHRPFGPESTPRGLPHDVPVYSQRGYRRRPLANVSPQGDVSLVYLPRECFEVLVAYYETHLRLQHWTISEVHDDHGDRYRAKRFDVEKGTRQGSIAIEEVADDLGPLERKVVTVSLDIPCWD